MERRFRSTGPEVINPNEDGHRVLLDDGSFVLLRQTIEEKNLITRPEAEDPADMLDLVPFKPDHPVDNPGLRNIEPRHRRDLSDISYGRPQGRDISRPCCICLYHAMLSQHVLEFDIRIITFS